MSYLVTQIAFALLIACLLSGVVAWLATVLLARRRQEEREDYWRGRLRQSDARAGTFKNQLAEAKQRAENFRSELQQGRDAAGSMESDPSGEPATIEALQADLASRDKKIEILQLQVAQSSSEWQSIKALKSDLAERQRRFDARGKQQGARLTTQLKESEAARLKSEQTIALLERRRDRLEESLKKRDSQIARLSKTPSAETAEAGTAGAEIAGAETIDTQPVEIEAVKIEAAEIEITQAGTTPAKRVDEEDDLKKIRGIGPVLHRKLNGLGVQSFRQIAAWSDDDIDRVASEIGGFPGRIRRDRWVEKAAELQREKDA